MARKTSVFSTARQKRASCASSRTLSSPANDGAVTRSHRIHTSARANTIGYAANASIHAAYGAASTHPARSSARIDDRARFGGGFRERDADGNRAVDGALLVGVGEEVEDLDHVRVEVEIARPLDVRGV